VPPPGVLTRGRVGARVINRRLDRRALWPIVPSDDLHPRHRQRLRASAHARAEGERVLPRERVRLARTRHTRYEARDPAVPVDWYRGVVEARVRSADDQAVALVRQQISLAVCCDPLGIEEVVSTPVSVGRVFAFVIGRAVTHWLEPEEVAVARFEIDRIPREQRRVGR